jgi:hypothetical protein
VIDNRPLVPAGPLDGFTDFQLMGIRLRILGAYLEFHVKRLVEYRPTPSDFVRWQPLVETVACPGGRCGIQTSKPFAEKFIVKGWSPTKGFARLACRICSKTFTHSWDSPFKRIGKQPRQLFGALYLLGWRDHGVSVPYRVIARLTRLDKTTVGKIARAAAKNPTETQKIFVYLERSLNMVAAEGETVVRLRSALVDLRKNARGVNKKKISAALHELDKAFALVSLHEKRCVLLKEWAAKTRDSGWIDATIDFHREANKAGVSIEHEGWPRTSLYPPYTSPG